MPTVSLVLITHNSEKTLERCLNSTQNLAAETIVVDDFSSDRTVELAQKYGAKVFPRKLEGFGEQKQFGLDQAIGPWIFLIDSDENLRPESVEEIMKIVNDRRTDSLSAFKIPRKNYYLGKWLRFGGKYPDYQVRLLKKAVCSFSNDLIHEKVMVQGEVGVLGNPLEHHSYPDLDTWLGKLKMFSRFRAEELYRKGCRPSFLTAIRFCQWRPLWRFQRRYFFKLGFLDGMPGFLACLHDALTEILTYQNLIQKHRGS